MYDGRHYDAECIDGVADYRDLPFFQRQPEAAMRLEPYTANPATVRNRGREPLYPAVLTPAGTNGPRWVDTATYRRYAVAGVLIGLGLLAVGLGGEWAIHRHLLGRTALLQVLFVDFEIIGQLVALVSPLVFFVLLPAHRPRAE